MRTVLIKLFVVFGVNAVLLGIVAYCGLADGAGAKLVTQLESSLGNVETLAARLDPIQGRSAALLSDSSGGVGGIAGALEREGHGGRQSALAGLDGLGILGADPSAGEPVPDRGPRFESGSVVEPMNSEALEGSRFTESVFADDSGDVKDWTRTGR